MLAAEAAYCALEDDLQHYLDTYESTHDYDEYHFDLDEIEHDPYVLLSLLCALHEGQSRQAPSDCRADEKRGKVGGGKSRLGGSGSPAQAA